MTNSQNDTSKCFSVILRRILCSGSLPTHPSDHITQFDRVKFDFPDKELKTEAKETEAKVQSPATPGIVARLMGLDSLPADINWVPKQKTLDSILRSRSVNFVDYLPEFDLTPAHHRRVTTSVSFREVPSFSHQQNHDCFVLCLEKAVGKTNEVRVNEKETEMSFEEVKLKKPERSKNKENITERSVLLKKKSECEENKKKACKGKDKPKRVSAGKPSSKVSNVLPHKKDVHRSPAKPVNPKGVSVGSNLAKKKMNQHPAKKVVPQCSSEDSGLMGLNSRAKSSSKIANCDYPSPYMVRTSNIEDDQELRTIENKADKPVIKTREIKYYIKVLGQICRLTEEDMKESNWVAQEVFKFEDFEELSIEFGQQILEIQLNQVVDELVGLHMMKNLTLILEESFVKL